MITAKGLLAGKLPFVRLGNGPRKLVIFPGLTDAVLDVTRQSWLLRSAYRRFSDEFTVYVISRQRRLPRGYTTRDMAADYAEAFNSEIGRAVVLGVSLGGYVAQNFAADYPQHIERLVIACAAHRVSDEGRATPLRWLALAKTNQWQEFYEDIATVTAQEFRQTFYRFMIPWLRLLSINPTDFLVSLEACLAHDSADCLPRIQVPTLVIGGTKDAFFPPALLHQTARLIRAATLRLIDGGGHGAFDIHKNEFETAVLDFLLDNSPPPAVTSDVPGVAAGTLQPVNLT